MPHNSTAGKRRAAEDLDEPHKNRRAPPGKRNSTTPPSDIKPVVSSPDIVLLDQSFTPELSTSSVAGPGPNSIRRAKSAASASIAQAAAVSNDGESQNDGSDSEPYASPGPGVRTPGVPKIYDFKFIDKIDPGENPIRAAKRRCLEVERKYGLSETWVRVKKIVNDPQARVHRGEDRCQRCREFDGKVPEGMEVWPCITEGKSKCTFCRLVTRPCTLWYLAPGNSQDTNLAALPAPVSTVAFPPVAGPSRSSRRNRGQERLARYNDDDEEEEEEEVGLEVDLEAPAMPSTAIPSGASDRTPAPTVDPAPPAGPTRGKLLRERRQFVHKMKCLLAIISESCDQVHEQADDESLRELLDEMEGDVIELEDVLRGLQNKVEGRL